MFLLAVTREVKLPLHASGTLSYKNVTCRAREGYGWLIRSARDPFIPNTYDVKAAQHSAFLGVNLLVSM